MNWLKLAEEDIRSCADDGTAPDLCSEEAKAVVEELDRLRALTLRQEAELNAGNALCNRNASMFSEAARELDSLRAKLEASREDVRRLLAAQGVAT